MNAIPGDGVFGITGHPGISLETGNRDSTQTAIGYRIQEQEHVMFLTWKKRKSYVYWIQLNALYTKQSTNKYESNIKYKIISIKMGAGEYDLCD